MVPAQRVALVVVAQHTCVEDLWDVAEAGDLVGAWAAGEELACTCPEGLFDCEKALALDKGAFDLAIVYGGVYGVAHILRVGLVISGWENGGWAYHHDVRSQHCVISGEQVELDF